MSILEDVLLRGTRAEQPANPPFATLYFVTDEGVTEQYTEGVGWESYSDPNDPQTYLHDDLTDVVPDQHHTRYTDAEAISAVGPIPPAQTFLHADLTDVSADQHHTRYTDREAQVAMADPEATDDIGGVTPWKDGYFSGTVNAASIGDGSSEVALNAMWSLATAGRLWPTSSNTQPDIGKPSFGVRRIYMDAGGLSLYDEAGVSRFAFAETFLRPSVTESADLGGTDNEWKDGYFSGTVTAAAFNPPAVAALAASVEDDIDTFVNAASPTLAETQDALRSVIARQDAILGVTR